MARIKTPSYIGSANGRMEDLVLYTIGTRQFSRMYVVPANPDTEAQRIVRGTFRAAVRSWQNMAREEKEAYNLPAAKQGKRGYNLYISMYMKGAVEDTGVTGAFNAVKGSSPAQNESVHNTAPSLLQCPCVATPLKICRSTGRGAEGCYSTNALPLKRTRKTETG